MHVIPSEVEGSLVVNKYLLKDSSTRYRLVGMTNNMKKQIKILVAKSYKNNQLDPKIVSMIADRLNRQSLKQYIRLLKQEEGKKQVIVTSPKSLTDIDKKKLQSQFPGKKFIYILFI